MSTLKRFVIVVSVVGTLWAESPAAKRWWAHVAYLASDRLEGRDTGSEGHKQAARYVAAQFERAGLKPAANGGYFQPVKFLAQRIDEPASSAELIHADRTEPLRLGEDVYFSLRGNPAAGVEGSMVFVGYGFAIPEHDYDELAGVDVKGKIVLYMNGGPKGFPAPVMSHYQSAEQRWKRLQSAGAVGIVTVPSPTASDIPWERAVGARFVPSMRLTGLERDGSPLTMAMNPARSEKFFAGSGHSLQELQALAKESKPLPKFALTPRLRTRLRMNVSPVESDNVAGLKPGSRPDLSRQHIVVSAHLDHLGVGRHLKGDQIYNGAMDNASGVAALIEIARTLKNRTLGRPVLFVTVTGEEKGLLGSRYFANFPAVPKEDIAANLNFDMFLPLFPLKKIIVYGVDESSLGDLARRAAEAMGIATITDPDPQRNSFIRSDQYSFIQRGIPSLAFKLGYATNSPEEKIFKGWLRERYHSVSDDLNQPLDKEAAAQFTALMTEIVTAVANEPRRPQWKDASFFRRFAQ